MNQDELNLLTQAIIQITGVTAFMIVFFVLTLKMIFLLSLYITKKRIKLKLSKFDLKEFDIFFDSKGLPTTLVSKKDNKVIFI
ncbi:hypothetical protein [Aliarcobacter butzleri]|uniref:hypothetical protein n=1 Tax=Aliarcobacter butzleri TaxID=28197 RepID=UPI00126A08AE|nr:hypothetical protein [Aliarcobacter butzleri]